MCTCDERCGALDGGGRADGDKARWGSRDRQADRADGHARKRSHRPQKNDPTKHIAHHEPPLVANQTNGRHKNERVRHEIDRNEKEKTRASRSPILLLSAFLYERIRMNEGSHKGESTPDDWMHTPDPHRCNRTPLGIDLRRLLNTHRPPIPSNFDRARSRGGLREHPGARGGPRRLRTHRQSSSSTTTTAPAARVPHQTSSGGGGSPCVVVGTSLGGCRPASRPGKGAGEVGGRAG